MDAVADRYLDLLAGVLTRSLFSDQETQLVLSQKPLKARLLRAIERRGYRLVRPVRAEVREEGRDWPSHAETMIGAKRMANLRYCVETALADRVPGDLIETGVWRGGAAIFMRAILFAHGVSDRIVWAADSFCGLPPPDAEKFPADQGDQHHKRAQLAVSLEEVHANFSRYGMLDEQVRFLVGWFADTLADPPIDQLAVARLDGDMYGSTWDAITALYPKLSPGGFLIVDDYGAVEGCRQAVHDYREKEGLSEPIQQIDWGGVFWRKT